MSAVSRRLKIGLVLIAIAGVISGGYFIGVVGRIQNLMHESEPEAANPFVEPAPPLYSAADPAMDVKIFFPPAQGGKILSTESRTIFKSAELPNRARQILQLVLTGPKSSDLLPAVPADTKLQEVFLSNDQVLYVDFSSALALNHPGGLTNEQATIYSIVDSLLFNLPEIRQIKILIGGTEQETLAGHCLLLLPLDMDLSITDEGTHAN